MGADIFNFIDNKSKYMYAMTKSQTNKRGRAKGGGMGCTGVYVPLLVICEFLCLY